MSTFPCHIVLFTGYLAALCQGLVSADNPQLCEEDPPPCSYLYKYYDDFTPLFETAAHGRVLRHVYTFKVDASQSLCSIDPFINIEPDIKDHIPRYHEHALRIRMCRSKHSYCPATLDATYKQQCVHLSLH